MLSKPQHGWTVFSLGESSCSLSYLSNIPLEWLDRAIFGLETLSPFDVYGECEPGKMVCTVEYSECRIRFENDKHIKNDCSGEVVSICMLDFCEMLLKDIADNIDDWLKWNPSFCLTREDLISRIDRLQRLIEVKASCFG